MKKTWVKGLALVLTSCMVLSMAACNSGTKNPANNAGGEGVDKPTGVSGEVDALVWLSSYPQVASDIQTDFAKKYPDIKLHMTMMSGNSTSENLEPRIASGNMPDVCSVDIGEWYYTNADKGYFVDLGGTKAWDNQNPSIQAQYTSPNGVKYGVAYGVAAMFIYYNKDLFAKAGITQVPTNWEEFIAACEALKAKGITPLAWPGGFPNMFGNSWISAGIANNVYRNDKDLVKKCLYEDYDYGTDAWVNIFQKNLDLVPYFQKGYKSADNEATIRAFANNEVAMTFNGSWSAGDFLTLGDHVDLFIPPWNAKGEGMIGNMAGETGFGMGKNNKGNEEAAKVFFNFVAFENYARFQNATGTIPIYDASACPGTKVDPRLMAGYEAMNKLEANSPLLFQIVPAAIDTAMMQFGQDTLLGSKKPADLGSIMNPIQKEYIASRG